MPALDATRRVFHPIENAFIPIPDNVQFIAAVDRGREFTGTFGIDAAQLDRFAPLQMDYPPPAAEVEILARRHPALSATNLKIIVDVADAIRRAADLPGSLSVRATDGACVYLEHPLFAGDGKRALPEILKTSFCGRFPAVGRRDQRRRRGVGDRPHRAGRPPGRAARRRRRQRSRRSREAVIRSRRLRDTCTRWPRSDGGR
jgi:hypothetical protein